MTLDDREALIVEVEAIVDRTSLAAVVNALTDLAYLKRDHIMESWGDRALAASWAKLARDLERVAGTAKKEGI